MAGGKLSALKAKALTAPGRYGDGSGLWLQVRDAEHRSWIFRYAVAGRQRQLGLGAYPDVGLAEARDAAAAARKAVRAGTDPIDARKAAREAAKAACATLTFSEVAEQFIASHESSWKNPKHRAQWRGTLESYVFPVFGDRSVAAIGVGEVMRVLEPIWRDKPETAARVRGRIESVLDYATARGWRTGDNPARWRGHLQNLLPAKAKVRAVEHHAALPYCEIGAFMELLRAQPGIGAMALQFTILTAARTGEVVGATWSEFDLAKAQWTVPAARMKAGVEHRVPLSPAAIAILSPLHEARTGDFVFPGGRAGSPLSTMAMAMTLRRMGRGDLTVHGFRSTFRDWAAERTGVAREVAESALAHTLKDKVEAAYRRGDLFEKRRRLMSDWATFCSIRVAAGAVLPMRRRSG